MGTVKPQPTIASRGVRNVLSNWAGMTFSLLVTFFLSPFVVNHLGATVYGIWVLVISLTGYLGLLDLGVRGAVTRYVARFQAQAQHEEASRVGSSALVVFTAAALLAISVAVSLSFFADRMFDIPEAYRGKAQTALVLAGMTIGTALVGGVFGGILAGLQRMDLTNGVEIAQSGLRAVAIVVALSSGLGLVALALIHLIFGLLTAGTQAWLVSRVYKELRLRWQLFDREHLRLIFSFSVYLFLLHISRYLIFYSDLVVIGVFLPVEMVTFFAIAGNLVTQARGVISGITTTISPMASAEQAGKGEEAVARVLRVGGRFASLVTFPITATFLLRGESFIGLWMGQQYAELSGMVLTVLTISLILGAGNYVAGSTMIGMGRHKGLVPLALGEAGANLVLSIALVRTMGVVGVAWGTTLPEVAAALLFWPWYVRRHLKIPAREYLVSIWLVPALGVLPFAVLTYLVDRHWPASNLLTFFAQVAALLPVALLGYWFICFSSGERTFYAAKLKELMARVLRRPQRKSSGGSHAGE